MAKGEVDATKSPLAGLRRSRRAGFALVIGLCVSALHPAADGQSRDSAGGSVVDTDAVLTANRATTWTTGAEVDDQARFVLLEGEVGFKLGSYGFEAKRAVIRIDLDKRPGRTIRHLAVYLDHARPAGSDQKANGPIQGRARRLLVTASTTGELSLETNLLQPAKAVPDKPLVEAANQRIDRYRSATHKKMLDVPEIPQYVPGEDETRQQRRAAIAHGRGVRLPAMEASEPSKPSGRGEFSRAKAGARAPEGEGPTQGGTEPESRAQGESAILPPSGKMRFNADRVVYEPATQKPQSLLARLTLIGDVRLFYSAEAESGASHRPEKLSRTMTLKAQRVVLFLSSRKQAGGQGGDASSRSSDDSQAGQGPGGGPLSGHRVNAADVEGIYLEDNAITTDGNYTVRAPRIYYDPQHNEAILLDAVFYTFDTHRDVPLYFRAKQVRQHSRRSFEARDARLTTSEFGKPHFAIGADRLTVHQTQRTDGSTGNTATAVNSTLRWYDVPLFYWPYLRGDAEDIPIKKLSVRSNNDGLLVESSYDLFDLAGQPAPENVGLTGDLDWRGQRGLGLGLDADYRLDNGLGRFDGYTLVHDNGEDDIGQRSNIDFDGQARGYGHFEQRQYLPEDFELSLEGAYVSDETFLEEFARSQAFSHREYETSVYLKKQDQSQAFTLYGRYDLTNFTPQLTKLQQPGYTVARGPEAGYYQTGTSFAEGLLTWYSENRVGRVKLLVGNDAPADRGFRNDDSLRAFGIPSSTQFEDAADSAGLPDQWVTRADSRHELTAPIQAGPVDVTPYASGRITAYDSDFSELSGSDDQIRLFGSVGTRLGTELSRTYSGVESRALDLHGMRHILEPQLDVFYAESTIDPSSLPVYDPEVESISEGTGLRVGATQTWQTKRGGPGRWRSVDWITWRTDLVFRGDQANESSEIPRYFVYRPEYSLGGDHLYTELLWMVTDTFGVSGDLIHSFEEGQVVQWSLGANLDHSDRLSSYVEYREINPLSTRLLSYGFTYQLTTKYRLGFSHRLSFAEGESRSLSFSLERRLPRWRLRFLANYDQIDDETTVGVTLYPVGVGVTPRSINLFPGQFR